MSLENSGLALFLWIVGAPLIGSIILWFWSPSPSRTAPRVATRAHGPVTGDTTARVPAAENERRNRL